jgi:hypothetical protein
MAGVVCDGLSYRDLDVDIGSVLGSLTPVPDDGGVASTETCRTKPLLTSLLHNPRDPRVMLFAVLLRNRVVLGICRCHPLE